MERGSFGDVIFYQDGSTLADESFNTFCMSLKGSQVQGSASFLILNIQVYQRLKKYLQGLMMTIIGLEIQNRLYWE